MKTPSSPWYPPNEVSLPETAASESGSTSTWWYKNGFIAIKEKHIEVETEA